MEDTSTFPLILAGPILRHTTPTSVTVWLACSQYKEFDLTIYDESKAKEGCSDIDKQVGTSNIQDSQNADTRLNGKVNRQEITPLGSNLYVTVITAKPDNNGCFPLDSLLSYSLSIRSDYPEEAQVLPEIAEVALNGNTRPTFYISQELRMLAYGSCRKPHGPSFDDQEQTQHKDSLALLADHMEENSHTLDGRPSHLFLVGDQIYADEIPQFIMPYVQKLAVKLLGHDIPLPGHDKLPADLNIDERCKLKKLCGLTSNAKDSEKKELLHLLSFGEYAVMYLLAFGNRINLTVPADAPKSDEAQSLRDFLDSQAQTRKTLANIATYMMFDDHDVTDDWNLNHSWYNQVNSIPAGKRVVSNALAAFWAFQAWGNMPEGHFSQDFQDAVQNHLMLPPAEQAMFDDTAKRFDFILHEFHYWAFTLPTTPPVFVLDCRTQRDFGTFNSPPNLLDRYAINRLHKAWFNMQESHNPNNGHGDEACQCDALAPKGTPIFITGTPVLGFSVIEWAQELLYRIGFLLGVSTGKLSASNLDIESWIANKQGFSGLLNTIRHTLGSETATFIAGDVHYSFTNRATFTCQCSDEQEASQLNCLQLTSSALRNTPPSGRYLETLLANAVTKTRRGHSKPETLPWWQRLFFWRFLQKDVWKIEVSGIPGKSAQPRPAPDPAKQAWWEPAVTWLLNNVWRMLEKRYGQYTDDYTYWITCRPNVALVYFKDGEVTKQVLLSGDQREHSLTFDVKTD